MLAQAKEKVADFTSTSVTYSLYDDFTAIVTAAEQYEEHITVPATIEHQTAYYTVVEIAAKAFYNCRSTLVTVNLPESLETIDGTAFSGCSKVTTIGCAAYTVPKVTGEDFSGVNMGNIILNVSEGYANLYEASSVFSKFKQIVEVYPNAMGSRRPELMIAKADLRFEPGTDKVLKIELANSAYYNGIQVDILLPIGVGLHPDINDNITIKSTDITGTTGEKNCNLSPDNVNGACRIVAFTNDNQPFGAKTELALSLKIDANFEGGELWFKNFVASPASNVTVDVVLDPTKKYTGKDKVYMVEVPEVEIESISLDKETLTLKAGDTARLSVTYSPDNATKKKVDWSTSDEAVAMVSNEGVVTAVAVGGATITATANGKKATCVVTVAETPAESVSITPPSTSTLKVGESISLVATVLPVTTTDKTLKWASSNTDVATVDADGRVRALKAGAVEITATCGSVSGKVSLTVIQLITKLSLSVTELSIEKGKMAQLTANYDPASPTRINLMWKSSDENVAVVSPTGEVQGIIPGGATITVMDTESGLEASCTISVTDIMYGDVDNDGKIVINDVTLLVDYILQRNPDAFVLERADIDKDGVIDIFDVTRTLELVLTQTTESVSQAYAAMNTRAPNEVVSAGVSRGSDDGVTIMPLELETEDVYSALQFDMVVPEGWTLADVLLTGKHAESHSISRSKVAGNIKENITGKGLGTIERVVAYSLSGATLDSKATLLELYLKPSESVEETAEDFLPIYNAIAATEDGKGIAVGDIVTTLRPMSEVESVDAEASIVVMPVQGGICVKASQGARIVIYTMAGIKVISQLSVGEDIFNLPVGIYIVVINGQSHKVRVS